MPENIKSGKEILDDFFDNIKTLNDVDENIVGKLIELYKAGKLTSTNISNTLAKLREDDENIEN